MGTFLISISVSKEAAIATDESIAKEGRFYFRQEIETSLFLRDRLSRREPTKLLWDYDVADGFRDARIRLD